jgi:hypothetical protein
MSKTHVPAPSGPNCPSTPLTGKTIAGQSILVSGAENNTVIVWFVESTVMAEFPLSTDAKQSLMYILPSVGATKLITFVVVGFAGFSAKAGSGESMVTWCHPTLAPLAVNRPPASTAEHPRQTVVVALLPAVIAFA